MEGLFVKWGLDETKVPPPVLASSEPILRFFAYHDAHPVAIVMVLLEKFGPQWFDWEADTLRTEIFATFNTSSISEHNWQKIQAARTAMMTYGPWREWQIFEKVLQALNNNVPRFDIAQPCTLSQLMAGVDILNALRREKFNEEIAAYVAACALEEGVFYLPPPLDFAQEKLSMPSYRCRRCGNEDLDDMGDGKCDFCCGRFQGERPLNLKPAEFVPPYAGDDVVRFLKHDPEPVKARYTQLVESGVDKPLDDDNYVDVQAAKLLVAREYLQLRSSQLTEQLEELRSWVTH